MVAWRRLLGLWDIEQPCTKVRINLVELIDQARLDWIAAQRYYRTVTDPDLIDYAIFLINAYERRYMYLLKKARQEGLSHPAGVSLTEITDAGGTIRQAF